MMTPADALAPYLRHPWAAAVPIPLEPRISVHFREHGIGPLVYRAMRDHHLLGVQPPDVQAELARLNREEAIVEPFRRAEATRVISALAAAGVDALVFKGGALAYTHYPEPCLRPRLDTDLLIRAGDSDAASRVFEGAGLTRALRTSGEHVTHQFTYVSSRHGLSLAFDVHWKVADPQAFADLFSFDELNREARPIPSLGTAAKAFGDAHALLIACTHRVAHHYDREVLIDLYDIDLLARQLDAAGWDRVAALASAKRICQVTMRGLALATTRLGTTVPDRVREALSRSTGDEPTAAYLAADFRKVDILRADLAALRWRDRIHLLREHLFPNPAFVLRSFGRTEPLLLPALYAIRIARGASAWFRPLR
jgi:hypothetical protein